MKSEEKGSALQVLFRNPFVVESPEKLSPNQIVELFVEEFTQIETVKQRKHTFVWGSRGSGKSMMLRYLEPQCQGIANSSVESFLEKEAAFLGVYCPCKEGYFNKTDLLLLDGHTSAILTEHLLNLYIAGRIVECLERQIPASLLDTAEIQQLATDATRLFDQVSISSSLSEVNATAKLQDAPLKWLQLLCSVENRKVNAFLRRNALRRERAIYEGATSGYHDFLLPFVRAIGQLAAFKSIPLYVLLDDADRLTRSQQLIVNTWIGNRDQEAICFKVASEFDGYKTFKKMGGLFETVEADDQNLLIEGGGLIEAPHDYSEIDIDELYTHSKSDYMRKVKLISNRRLSYAEVGTENIEDFLPPDPNEAKLFQEMKDKAEKEWEDGGRPGRREDYIYRYATARLFQHLRAGKQRKSYAGFEIMVDLSSGIVRSFLEPCYLMFDRMLSRSPDQKAVKAIPSRVQNEVLFKYSEEFFVLDIEKIRKDLPSDKWTILEAFSTLLGSLGRLYYERLHDPEAREARLFSFSVRGRIPEGVDEILRLGVRYRYFQLRTYSTKEGGGRERWYILNRRLCPVFKLDPTGFEGRISLTAEHLRLACEDQEKFVRLRLRQAEPETQLRLFSLEA